jgi:hypothetical protein
MTPSHAAAARPVTCTHTWQYVRSAQTWLCLLCGGQRLRGAGWISVSAGTPAGQDDRAPAATAGRLSTATVSQ